MTGKNVLLYGRFRPTDGFRRVVDVFPQVVKSIPSARLVIAGAFKTGVSSIFKADFLFDIRRSKALFVHKRLGKKDLQGLFASARVLVFPYEAGWDSKAVELGLKSGLPLITSDLTRFTKLKKGVIVRNDAELIKAICQSLRPGVS
jgi:glycosyltransferase involved in cell wall biosynthesis